MLEVEKEVFIKMPASESQTKASLKYAKKHLKRVPLDMQLSDYERLKDAATRAVQTVNGYIKQAIAEKMEREG